MADTKLSALTLRTTLAETDEFPNLAGGANYRSPLSSIVLYLEQALIMGDASEATLVEIRNKISADQATGALQTTGNNALSSILGALGPLSDVATEASLELLRLAAVAIRAAVEGTLDVNITNAGVALAATADSVSSALATDRLMNGLTELTPKFAVIDAASSGDNTLLAAVASKKIRVVSLFVVAAGTATVRFESGAGGTALTGQMSLAANSQLCLPFNPLGWFETASNTLLNMELSAAVSVDGSFTYVEV